MSARLARLALALYPLAYRRRYGAEMAALVEDAGGSPTAVVDLVRGAARAHLRPEPAVAAELGREDRLRLAVSGVLLYWILFAAAGLALYKATERRTFDGAGAPGLLEGVHLAIQVVAGVGSLALALGAAPLVVTALRQGRERPEVRRATLLAGGCVATFVAATAALVAVANAKLGLGPGVEVLILTAWTLVALGCGIGCALAARHGLFATAVAPRPLRFAGACAAVVAGAMGTIVVLLAVYLVDLIAAAPGLAGEPNGPLGPSLALSLALQLAAMATFALLAGLCVRRARPR